MADLRNSYYYFDDQNQSKYFQIFGIYYLKGCLSYCCSLFYQWIVYSNKCIWYLYTICNHFSAAVFDHSVMKYHTSILSLLDLFGEFFGNSINVCPLYQTGVRMNSEWSRISFVPQSLQLSQLWYTFLKTILIHCYSSLRDEKVKGI